MAEMIEVLFGVWIWVGPRNLVLHEGTDPPGEGQFLEGILEHADNSIYSTK